MIQLLKRLLKHAMVRIQSTKEIDRCVCFFYIGKVDMIVAGAGTGELVKK
jgi:hypothetical protein